MAMIDVVCGVVYDIDGKVLICRRSMHKSLGGYWEFPGGKVESGETLECSLARELLEELDMEVEICDFMMEVVHAYGDVNIRLSAFRCSFISATFTLTDHDSFKWVSPVGLKRFNLAPADLPIARTLAGC